MQHIKKMEKNNQVLKRIIISVLVHDICQNKKIVYVHNQRLLWNHKIKLS